MSPPTDQSAPNRILYMFVDESGNFDFSESGTRFYTMTCMTTERSFKFCEELDNYKYDLIESDCDIESFHCSEDNLTVRSNIFRIIKHYLVHFQIHSVIVEKRKIEPSMQKEDYFYTLILGVLLVHVFRQQDINLFKKIVIITDNIPTTKKRKTIEKSIKQILKKMLPVNVQYTISHHASKAHYGLQMEYF